MTKCWPKKVANYCIFWHNVRIWSIKVTIQYLNCKNNICFQLPEQFSASAAHWVQFYLIRTSLPWDWVALYTGCSFSGSGGDHEEQLEKSRSDVAHYYQTRPCSFDIFRGGILKSVLALNWTVLQFQNSSFEIKESNYGWSIPPPKKNAMLFCTE